MYIVHMPLCLVIRAMTYNYGNGDIQNQVSYLKTFQFIVVCDVIATLMYILCHIISTEKKEITLNKGFTNESVTLVPLVPKNTILVMEFICIIWMIGNCYRENVLP